MGAEQHPQADHKCLAVQEEEAGNMLTAYLAQQRSDRHKPLRAVLRDRVLTLLHPAELRVVLHPLDH